MRIFGLKALIDAGQNDPFSVIASNLVSGRSYKIELSVSERAAGFNSSCSQREAEGTVSSTSRSRRFTLYGCRAGTAELTVTLYRKIGTLNIKRDSADQTVTVRAPSVRISGLRSPIKAGLRDRFTVGASNLDSSRSYTVVLSASNVRASFESDCSTTSVTLNEDVMRSRYNWYPYLYGCRAGSVRVTARLYQWEYITTDNTPALG